MTSLRTAKELLQHIKGIDEDAVVVGLYDASHPISEDLGNWLAAACAATGTSESVVWAEIEATRSPWHAICVAIACHNGGAIRMLGTTAGQSAESALTRAIGLYPTALASIAPHGGAGAHVLTLHVVNASDEDRGTLQRRVWQLSNAYPLGTRLDAFFAAGNASSRQ